MLVTLILDEGAERKLEEMRSRDNLATSSPLTATLYPAKPGRGAVNW